VVVGEDAGKGAGSYSEGNKFFLALGGCGQPQCAILRHRKRRGEKGLNFLGDEGVTLGG